MSAHSWKPQFVFPLTCLLLGSSVNGVSLSLDAITTSIVEESAEIQLLQAFGGSKYESLHRILTLAIQKGTSSTLSTMRATGASGILPMFMCGQIFSGISVKQAILYQIMVIILVALCTVSSVVLSTMAAAESTFGPAEVVKPEYFGRNRKSSLLGLLWVVYSSMGKRDGSTKSVVKHPSFEKQEPPALSSAITIHSIFHCVDDAPLVLEASALSFFEKSNREETCGVSIDGTSLRLREGEILTIDGENAMAKSEFFHTLAGLRPFHGGILRLDGKSLVDLGTSEWRKEVLLLPPGNPRISGTPIQFVRRVSGFQTHVTKNLEGQEYFRDLIDEVSYHLFGWDLHIDCLNKDWKALSNEEGYLVLLSFALATRPKVLLLEFDGMLSSSSKKYVEKIIQKFVQEERGAVLWLSGGQLVET
jgi:ABC-type iron transport system FetAB ATPase subunit